MKRLLKLLRRNRPRTVIGWFNFLVAQWFFFRIGYGVDPKTGTTSSYGLIVPVIPLTGWVGNMAPSWLRVFIVWRAA